jgi:hypothetical protein
VRMPAFSGLFCCALGLDAIPPVCFSLHSNSHSLIRWNTIPLLITVWRNRKYSKLREVWIHHEIGPYPQTYSISPHLQIGPPKRKKKSFHISSYSRLMYAFNYDLNWD